MQMFDRYPLRTGSDCNAGHGMTAMIGKEIMLWKNINRVNGKEHITTRKQRYSDGHSDGK